MPLWNIPVCVFLHARADETVWVMDCDGSPSKALPSIRKHMLVGSGGKIQTAVEHVLGRPCQGPLQKLTMTVRTLTCTRNIVGVSMTQ